MTEPNRVTVVAHVTTHTATALERVLLSKPIYQALVKTYVDRLQELENVLWALYTDTLDTATGHSLDVLGKIVLEPRGVLVDAEYRTLIRAKIRALRSDGTGEDLIAVTLLMLNAVGTGKVQIRQYPRATVVVEPQVETLYPETMLRLLMLAKAGGVKLQLITVPSEDIFAFCDSGIVNASDPLRGWSDTGGLVGGRLVGVVE
jgi:hypothetical protein